ncbi:GNAT family N-acetyltransferase [Actinacidiphila guanduensis]|uniref:Acetyltransferase (GNAT) family protein n=1 Tax=Actinacidiphila guanduensis TaxID=310781 RepID=A0A1H0PWN5_9ACTN|nr:GNAT family N-acetyltransferase [Actinacidiphila guanduensis]SDP09562.1 Acetyltransferase (GNAT) family protein [Actinacidiphila guanduensis]
MNGFSGTCGTNALAYDAAGKGRTPWARSDKRGLFVTASRSLPLAEASEAEALFRFETGAPEAVRSALGMNATRVGDAFVLSVRNDPTQFWSKALGFGRTSPVTSELIAEVCAFYRAEGTPLAVLQLAPSVIPEDWAEICAREGIVGGSSWVKLVGEVDEVVARADAPDRKRADGIRVAPVAPGDAERWASVMMDAFGMPGEHLRAMAAASVTDPDWSPHGAWLDGELVGAGTVHHGGEAGQMFGGAVLPHARNRGGQTELLAARARAAAEFGCRLLVAETGAETDGSHNSSLHNMLRLGFEVAYERRNWVWRPKS